MAIGKFNSEQVAQILTAYSQETEQLFFLVDKEFKVCYFNKPFTDYFKLNASEIKDQYFGEALACKNSVKGKQACTLNVYCGICEIKKNLNLIFNKIKKRAEFFSAYAIDNKRKNMVFSPFVLPYF